MGLDVFPKDLASGPIRAAGPKVSPGGSGFS
jgi:hypothetical protein